MGAIHAETASHLVYLGLYSMQHRGQEACGISSNDHDKSYHKKGLGLVGEVFNDHVLKALPGSIAIGHVRYSTSGANDITNAQPLHAEIKFGVVSVVHNGNITNAKEIRKKLKDYGAIFQGSSDTELILHMLARETTDNFEEALTNVCSKLEGAFSLLFLSGDKIYAIRDAHGFRPLVYGQRGNSLFIASETCAFDLIGAKYLGEILPGEICTFHRDKIKRSKWAKETSQRQCIFENIYFARPDSLIFGTSVYQTRKSFGRQLALECPTEADLVIPVPDSGVPAALGFSEGSKIPFEFGIIRNHYVGRTFIQPESSIRAFGVKVKLNPQSAILKGKRVVVIDDSLVRGTTSQQIIQLLRTAGAVEVHLRIAAPPTTGPCFYGVDTPQKQELIASNHSIEQIRQFIGADSLKYLSIEGMFMAVGAQHQAQDRKFCAACFDGEYPTPLYS